MYYLQVPQSARKLARGHFSLWISTTKTGRFNFNLPLSLLFLSALSKGERPSIFYKRNNKGKPRKNPSRRKNWLSIKTQNYKPNKSNNHKIKVISNLGQNYKNKTHKKKNSGEDFMCLRRIFPIDFEHTDIPAFLVKSLNCFLTFGSRPPHKANHRSS